MSSKKLFDLHTHSLNSHDAKCTVSDMAEAVKGNPSLCGFAVTDHCDISYYVKDNIAKKISNSVADAKAENEANSGITVLAGVEIGEGFRDLPRQTEILTDNSFDVILGSVHLTVHRGKEIHISHEDFSVYSDREIFEFMGTYFDDIIKLLEKTPIDILAHLTYPLRYINGKYGRNFDVSLHKEKTDLILKKIIEKGIALELNTSGIGTDYNEFMPPQDILQRYKELGGTLISLGSDAHTAERAGNGFDKAVALLKDLGFTQLVYFKNRTPFEYEI